MIGQKSENFPLQWALLMETQHEFKWKRERKWFQGNLWERAFMASGKGKELSEAVRETAA